MLSRGIVDNGDPVAQDIMDALLDSNLSTRTFGNKLGVLMVRRI